MSVFNVFMKSIFVRVDNFGLIVVRILGFFFFDFFFICEPVSGLCMVLRL